MPRPACPAIPSSHGGQDCGHGEHAEYPSARFGLHLTTVSPKRAGSLSLSSTHKTRGLAFPSPGRNTLDREQPSNAKDHIVPNRHAGIPGHLPRKNTTTGVPTKSTSAINARATRTDRFITSEKVLQRVRRSLSSRILGALGCGYDDSKVQPVGVGDLRINNPTFNFLGVRQSIFSTEFSIKFIADYLPRMGSMVDLDRVSVVGLGTNSRHAVGFHQVRGGDTYICTGLDWPQVAYSGL